MAAVRGSMPGLPTLYARALVQAARAAATSHPGRTTRTDPLSAELFCARGVPLAPRLAAYREVCGFTRGDAVPGSYPQALAFPLQLAVLTASGFPFPALGAVHVSNTIEQEVPLSRDDVVDLSVLATDLRPHRRGRQVTLVTEARVDGQVGWRARSDLLHRERPAGSDESSRPSADPPAATAEMDDPGGQTMGTATWQLPADLGRRYAAISGDRNPIHLYDVTARPFGFRRHIAHGMLTAARCLAELEAGLPDRYRFEVMFRHPVELPGEVEFTARADGDRTVIQVRSVPAGATHLCGSVVGR